MTTQISRYPEASWEKVDVPEEMGWSTERLQVAQERSSEIGSAALMIVTGGKVVVDWGETGQRFSCHSMRKSLLSSLIGIAVYEGKIDLSQTIAELKIDDNEPRLTAREKESTVADLLKARSGIYHPSNCQPNTMLPERGSHEHGAFWHYNNWDFNTLGTIFELCIQKSIFTEFEQRLAAPLQMQDFESQNIFYRFMSPIKEAQYWFEVPMNEFERQGPLFLRRDSWENSADIELQPMENFPYRSCYYVGSSISVHPCYWFRLSARDLARFGWLFLNDGQWKGVQVVPSEWVKESTASYSNAWSGSGYGYMWWIAVDGNMFPGVKLPEGTFAALGSGGHSMLIIPALDTVIVHRMNTDVEGTRVSLSRVQQAPLLQAVLGARLE